MQQAIRDGLYQDPHKYEVEAALAVLKSSPDRIH